MVCPTRSPQSQRHILFIRLNTMQGGISPTGGRGRTGFSDDSCRSSFPSAGRRCSVFHFQPARQPVKSARLQIVCHLRSQRILGDAGYASGSSEIPRPQKQPLTAERDLPCTHHIAGQPAQITAIPDDVHPPAGNAPRPAGQIHRQWRN